MRSVAAAARSATNERRVASIRPPSGNGTVTSPWRGTIRPPTSSYQPKAAPNAAVGLDGDPLHRVSGRRVDRYDLVCLGLVRGVAAEGAEWLRWRGRYANQVAADRGHQDVAAELAGHRLQQR